MPVLNLILKAWIEVLGVTSEIMKIVRWLLLMGSYENF